MINNVVLFSGVQQSDSVIHILVSILFEMLFPFRLLQSAEQNGANYLHICFILFAPTLSVSALPPSPCLSCLVSPCLVNTPPSQLIQPFLVVVHDLKVGFPPLFYPITTSFFWVQLLGENHFHNSTQ